MKYRSVSTDFGSLERELRSGEDPYPVIPDAYADLADSYSPSDDDEEFEADEDADSDEDYGGYDLRKSG